MPRGTVDRRFRGNNCGKGANLTLRVGIEEDDEEEDVVVGRVDGNSKDEDLDEEEISLLKGILRVKWHVVDFVCESTSSAMDFVGEMIIHQMRVR